LTVVSTLLDELAARGVELWLEGDRIRYRGPAGAMPPPLLAQLRECRPGLLVHLREQLAASRTVCPASWNQLALWLAHDSLPGSDACHMGVAFRITSPVNPAALEAALQAVVDRHSSLRTSFVATGDELMQGVVGFQPVDFECVPVGASEHDLSERVQEAYRAPFALSERVLRARLFMRADDAVLLLVMHRIAADATSVFMAVEECFENYPTYQSDLRTSRPRPEVQYTEFTEWQRRLLDSDEGAALRRYWATCLAGCQPLAGLGDRPRTATMSAKGATIMWEVDRRRTERLKGFAASQQTSLFVVLLAVYKALLYRYTGQTDIIVAGPTLGRSRAAFMNLVGDVANTVAFRTDLEGTPSFRTLVARVRDTTLAALKHADYPYARLVRDLDARRDTGRMPLTDVLFDFQNPQSSAGLVDVLLPLSSELRVRAGDLELAPYAVEPQDVQFDLAHRVVERDGLHVRLHYRCDLFEPATIERFASDWRRAIDELVDTPDMSIAEFAPGTVETFALATPPFEEADSAPLDRRFSRQAIATPDRVAVADEHGQLTYAQLDRLADGVAAALQRLGVSPGMRVAVLVTPSARTSAVLLGVLKAGAVHVAVDLAESWTRIERGLSACGASCVIAERQMAEALRRMTTLPVCVMEELRESPIPVSAARGPDEVACLLYAAGDRRGASWVQLTHRAIAHAVAAARARFGADHRPRGVAIGGASQFSSLVHTFGVLCHGGSLFVPSAGRTADGETLAQLLREWQPTLLQSSAATWRLLLDGGWQGSDSLVALVDGDTLDAATAAALVGRCRRAFRILELLESGECVASVDLARRAGDVVTGQVMPGIQPYVLTPGGLPVARGAAGELWVRGESLATAAVAADEPSPRFRSFTAGGAEVPLCSTGIIARWRDDGLLEWLGRAPRRVRIRGRGLDLGEVESALERHPQVRRAGVRAVTAAGRETRVVAYIEADPVSPADLRRFLYDELPEYALPAVIRPVDRLPLTADGRVDRHRLAAVAEDVARIVVPPRTSLEHTLVAIWEELLETRPVGVTDNFFELGGHSMLAARLCSRVGEITGRRLHIAALLQAPTVEQFAARLEDDAARADALLVPIRSGGVGRPYFCVPGAGDNPFIFSDVAAHLAPDRPVYSFRLPERTAGPGQSPAAAVEMAASALVREMRAVDPSGPYLLGGYCLGGLLAFEMARQLHEAGQTVASLTVFESYLPGGLRQGHWRDRLAHQWTHVRRLSWRDRAEFVRRMAARRLIRMARRRSARLGRAIAPLATAGDYVPRHVFAGPLTLFRAHISEAGLVPEHEMGWRGLARTITVHQIAGHHTDAYKEPHVSAWIGQLRGVLRRADEAGGPQHRTA
jgi:non-ribosomal peptide synthetase component F/thioesterase domain-containing protein